MKVYTDYGVTEFRTLESSLDANNTVSIDIFNIKKVTRSLWNK